MLNYEEYVIFKEKFQIFEYMNSYLKNRMDVFTYLKYLDKFDKFKLIYFNENQQYAFDLEQKSNIDYKFLSGKVENKPFEFNLNVKEKIISYYKNSINNNLITNKDKKIFDNLPSNLKENIYFKIKSQ